MFLFATLVAILLAYADLAHSASTSVLRYALRMAPLLAPAGIATLMFVKVISAKEKS